MKTAQTIHATITTQDFVAVTLSGGYAIKRNGDRVLFSPCHNIEVKRASIGGRCTRLLGQYSDGSQILYTWSEASGPKYTLANERKAK